MFFINRRKRRFFICGQAGARYVDFLMSDLRQASADAQPSSGAGLTAAVVQSAVADCPLVRRVYFFDEIGSTSDWAKILISRTNGSPDLDGTLIVANHQTAGRGRFNRRWKSPAGTSLLFSLVLSADRSTPDGLFPLKVAVAVCEALRLVAAADSRIKYPNDILVGGRKIAGLLLEQVTAGTRMWRVVGIGVNLNQAVDELPADARTPATSVAITSGTRQKPEAVLAAILIQIAQILEMPDAQSATLLNKLCDTIGRHVTAEVGTAPVCGVAMRIADDGALIIREDSGREQAIYAADVSFVQTGVKTLPG